MPSGPIQSSIICVFKHYFGGKGENRHWLDAYHLRPSSFKVKYSNTPTPVYASMACKGEVHPKTESEVPEGEQRFSCTFSLISALDRGR